MGVPLLAALLIIAPLHSCAQMPDLDVSTCGSTTGCYFHPANCDTNSTCVYVATWGALTNPNISAVVARYQIWATEVEWAAILVSEDAFVVGCVSAVFDLLLVLFVCFILMVDISTIIDRAIIDTETQ